MCRPLLLYDAMNSACRVSIVIVLVSRCDELYDVEHDKQSVQSMAKTDRFTLQTAPDTVQYVTCYGPSGRQLNYRLAHPSILRNAPTLSLRLNTDMDRLLNHTSALLSTRCVASF